MGNKYKIMSEGTNKKKLKIALKFVNKILTNLGKDEITELTDFKGIDRLDIIKPENKQVALDMEDEIFKVFSKSKCGYYTRNKVKNFILTLLRGMASELGYIFESSQADVSVVINGENFRKTHMFYSFKYIEN